MTRWDQLYATSPAYSALVDYMVGLLACKACTPADLRDASLHAAVLRAEASCEALLGKARVLPGETCGSEAPHVFRVSDAPK